MSRYYHHLDGLGIDLPALPEKMPERAQGDLSGIGRVSPQPSEPVVDGDPHGLSAGSYGTGFGDPSVELKGEPVEFAWDSILKNLNIIQ